jgi:sn-glycerol 3-phosphate transport system ATP-binding protein
MRPTQEQTMADIAIRSVRKRYGTTEIIHGLDLAIGSGAFVVILGPSGCGKSTLLRMIAGLEAISEGEIAIDGKVVNALEPRDRGCAMVFQNYALYPHMSVAANIGYALKVAGVAREQRRERVAKVAELLGLADLLERKPAALSGGQRQRVAMGRAMIREPKVFLFDEPLSNLDAQLRVQLRAEIRRLHKRLNATSIFVTHDQVEAMTLADMLVVMNAGKIEQVGTPAEIYGRPASRFVAGFVGLPAMNFIEGCVEVSGYFSPEVERWRALRMAVGQQHAGRRVAIGIRPESARLSLSAASGVAANVDFVEEFGATRVVYADVGRSFAVALNDGPAPRMGDPVWIWFDPMSMHVFCAETGGRLAMAQSEQRAGTAS